MIKAEFWPDEVWIGGEEDRPWMLWYGEPHPMHTESRKYVPVVELEATQQRLGQLLEAVKELREAEDPRVHYGALKRTCQVAREIEKERKS